MARSGKTRRIRKAALKELVGENKRGFARKLVGEQATKRQVELARRLLLKHLATEGESVDSMSPATAARYAAALGVPEDQFLEPPPRELDEVEKMMLLARRLDQSERQRLLDALRDAPENHGASEGS